MTVDQFVKCRDRQAEHPRTHEEEPGWTVGEALLVRLERHPAGVRIAANPPAKPHTVVSHPRVADDTGSPKVALHELRKSQEVGLGHKRLGSRPGEPHRSV